MLDAIKRIEAYTGAGRPAFDQDELVQTWVLHHIQIIGEAARSLSPAAQSAAPGVPWRKIIGMRNIVVHDYFWIDADAVWSTVEHDLPPLKSEILKLLDRGGS